MRIAGTANSGQVLGLAIIFASVAGCSGSSSDGGGSSPGGVVSTGGQSSGGSTQSVGNSGGSPGSGGAVGAGGTITKGGATGSGGLVGSGGAVGPGGSVGRGGATGLGGAVGQGGAVGAGGGTGSSCVAGVDTGDACNPAVDVDVCVRSTRECTCSGSAWACTPTGGEGGATGSGGSSPATGGSSPATGGSSSAAGGSSSSSGGSSSAAGGIVGTGGVSAEGGATGTGGTTDGVGGSAPITCPSTKLASGNTTETVQVGSSSRTYILHVPSQYDGSKPVPLIVDFHPIGGSGQQWSGSSPYPAQTDADGAIVAFPTGESGPMGGAWNVGPCCVSGPDDVEFARALVAKIQESACIDPKRVYAVGFSMGGGMSHYAACHAADLFAAVAPAAFDLLDENVGDCKPSRPITVFAFRGTGDSVVPYDGGYSPVVSGMPITFLGAKSTFEKWAELNKCTGSPSAEDGKGCSTYSDCQDGVQVTLCTKQGGGHEAGDASVAWPVLKTYVMP